MLLPCRHVGYIRSLPELLSATRNNSGFIQVGLVGLVEGMKNMEPLVFFYQVTGQVMSPFWGTVSSFKRGCQNMGRSLCSLTSQGCCQVIEKGTALYCMSPWYVPVSAVDRVWLTAVYMFLAEELLSL